MSAKIKPYQGLWQIIRFNPWFYAVAISGLVAGATMIYGYWEVAPLWLKLLVAGGYGLACWWTLVSLLVSHWVYDRSDWPRGQWFQRMLLGTAALRILNVHAGFDETTRRLRAWLPGSSVQSLSLFDPTRLTEKSIHRAAAYRPSPNDERLGSPEAWPVPVRTYDLVCFLLSAHEFRQHKERVALLQRAAESLAVGEEAAILLVEHVRDAANFMAFGPGFLHFHSVATWQRAWEAAGLKVLVEDRVTPFLRLWKLAPRSR
jgi:hypothetical protein